MSILEAVILGLVQGLAEFLPISSSGHLALLQKLFQINEGGMTFSVLLHIATLIPVLIVFREIIGDLIGNPFQKMTLFLIIGTIPTVLAALFLGDIIDQLFSTGQFLALGFIITGALLMYADRIPEGRRRERDMTEMDALIVGCLQAVAIAPAISRSGSTITASLSRRLDRDTAARFSFLLSIPAILGGAVLELKKLLTGNVGFQSNDLLPYAAGFIVAMLSGYLAIHFMLNAIQQCKLRYFSYYVFALAAFLLLDQFVLHLIVW